jgi:hypothetical protein
VSNAYREVLPHLGLEHFIGELILPPERLI